MDLPQLRCFLAVADELHFGRAATRLHLTPSPVSRMVKELERELGGALFVRRYHDVQLTPLGLAMVERIRSIVRGVDELKPAADALHDYRVIHVGGTHRAPLALIDRFVELAEKIAHPHPVQLVVSHSAELLPRVASGEIDVAVVHLPVDIPGLNSVIIETYSFFVAMRADDPLSSADELTLAELSDRTLTVQPVTPQPLAMARVRERLARAGLTKFYEMPDYDPVLLASHIRRTSGLVLVLHPSTGGASSVFSEAAYTVVPLRDDIELSVGVVWNVHSVENSATVSNLVNAVRDLRSSRDTSFRPDL